MKNLLAILLLTLLSCNSNRVITIAQLPSGTKLIGILNKDQKPDLISANFNLLNLSIQEDYLKLNVTYGGGCRSHEFHAYLKQKSQDTITIGIIHNANDDPCRALLEETIWFDLSTMQEKKKSSLYVKVLDKKSLYQYK